MQRQNSRKGLTHHPRRPPKNSLQVVSLCQIGELVLARDVVLGVICEVLQPLQGRVLKRLAAIRITRDLPLVVTRVLHQSEGNLQLDYALACLFMSLIFRT